MIEAFGISYNELFDTEASHSKEAHGILFINVCLTMGNKYLDLAKFSIGFLNRILKMKREQNKRIAVLDMRLDIHSHISELGFRFDNLRKCDPAYKLENLGFHDLVRLGHPSYYETFYVKTVARKLKSISLNMHQEVASIYRYGQFCM